MKYVILFALLLIPFSAAIGISPAQTELLAGQQQEIVFDVINDNQELLQARIFVEELQEFVSIDTQTVQLTSQQRQEIRAQIQIPQQTPPGTYTGSIVVEEQLQGSVQENTVQGLPAVKHTVQIIVPADGKHIGARILLSTSATDIPIRVTVPVRNIGTQDITAVSAQVTITSPQQQTQTLQTSTQELRVGQTKNLETTWRPQTAGPYQLQADITYDNQQIQLQQEVDIGDMVLEVDRPIISDFVFGDIAQITLPVTNQWGDTLRGVNAQIEIRNQQGQLVDTLQSPSVTIPALAQANITVFWETQQQPAGIYQAQAIISYPPKSVVTSFEVGYEQQETNTVVYILATAILIIFIYIIWFLNTKRREHE